MKKCAFLTMDDLNGLACFDHLCIPPLNKLGWLVDEISWQKKEVNWSEYDLVVIRSTWDYQDHEEAFTSVLKTIDNSSARLLNPLSIVKWNISKTYLKKLAASGVPIVPTQWFSLFDLKTVTNAFTYFSTDEIVIKPCVSAGSFNTFRLTLDKLNTQQDSLLSIFANREFMVQPFLPEIVNNGEYSLFFFNNTLSHAILKKPKQGDFRVQEEYGGHLSKITPSETLLSASLKAISSLNPAPLYVRVDMASYENEFVLMELELIEPSLYFNMDSEAPARFANAINQVFLN